MSSYKDFGHSGRSLRKPQDSPRPPTTMYRALQHEYSNKGEYTAALRESKLQNWHSDAMFDGPHTGRINGLPVVPSYGPSGYPDYNADHPITMMPMNMSMPPPPPRSKLPAILNPVPATAVERERDNKKTSNIDNNSNSSIKQNSSQNWSKKDYDESGESVDGTASGANAPAPTHIPTQITRARKPYTITKSRESWTEEEHEKFLEAINLYDRNWKQIEDFIKTKSVLQIRSHAQKHFSKVLKHKTGEYIPPPRPKRKASMPYPKNKPDDKTKVSSKNDKDNYQVRYTEVPPRSPQAPPNHTPAHHHQLLHHPRLPPRGHLLNYPNGTDQFYPPYYQGSPSAFSYYQDWFPETYHAAYLARHREYDVPSAYMQIDSGPIAGRAGVGAGVSSLPPPSASSLFNTFYQRPEFGYPSDKDPAFQRHYEYPAASLPPYSCTYLPDSLPLRAAPSYPYYLEKFYVDSNEFDKYSPDLNAYRHMDHFMDPSDDNKPHPYPYMRYPSIFNPAEYQRLAPEYQEMVHFDSRNETALSLSQKNQRKLHAANRRAYRLEVLKHKKSNGDFKKAGVMLSSSSGSSSTSSYTSYETSEEENGDRKQKILKTHQQINTAIAQSLNASIKDKQNNSDNMDNKTVDTKDIKRGGELKGEPEGMVSGTKDKEISRPDVGASRGLSTMAVVASLSSTDCSLSDSEGETIHSSGLDDTANESSDVTSNEMMEDENNLSRNGEYEDEANLSSSTDEGVNPTNAVRQNRNSSGSGSGDDPNSSGDGGSGSGDGIVSGSGEIGDGSGDDVNARPFRSSSGDDPTSGGSQEQSPKEQSPTLDDREFEKSRSHSGSGPGSGGDVLMNKETSSRIENVTLEKPIASEKKETGAKAAVAAGGAGSAGSTILPAAIFPRSADEVHEEKPTADLGSKIFVKDIVLTDDRGSNEMAKQEPGSSRTFRKRIREETELL